MTFKGLHLFIIISFICGTRGQFEDNFLQNLNCPEIPVNTTHCHYINDDKFDRSNVHQKNMWVALTKIGCHADLNRFLCSVYSPICLKSHHEANILPCREFCEEIHDKCLAIIQRYGLVWPESTNCSLFPKQLESMCIPLDKSEKIKCNPCEQDLRKVDLQKEFCNAEVVLIGQLIRSRNYEVEQGIQNIRLTLGPRTKPLRLKIQNGNFTSIHKQLNFIYEGGQRRFRRHPGNFQSFSNYPLNYNRGGRFKRSLSIMDYKKLNENNRREAEKVTTTQKPLKNPRPMSEGERQNEQIMNRRRFARRMKSTRNRRESRIWDLDGINELNVDCSVCSQFQAAGITNADKWFVIGERIKDENNTFTNVIKVKTIQRLTHENAYLRPYIRYWRRNPNCQKDQL